MKSPSKMNIQAHPEIGMMANSIRVDDAKRQQSRESARERCRREEGGDTTALMTIEKNVSINHH